MKIGWDTVVPQNLRGVLKQEGWDLLKVAALLREAAKAHMMICKPSQDVYGDLTEEATRLFLEHHGHIINALDGIEAQAGALIGAAKEGKR